MDITQAKNKESGIVAFDFSELNHLKVLARFIEDYMNDPMGDTLREGPIKLSERKKFKLLSGLQTNPCCRIFLWNENYNPVAIAICFETFSTFLIKPVLNIHDFFVDHEYRNQRIGSQFLEKLITKFSEADFGKITLEVRIDNDAAQGLYRKLGFNPTHPNMLFWVKKI